MEVEIGELRGLGISRDELGRSFRVGDDGIGTSCLGTEDEEDEKEDEEDEEEG